MPTWLFIAYPEGAARGVIIIIIIIIDYSHMPIRHKKEKEKGDIKSYEHDKFTSRSSKGDTTPNT